MYRVFKIVGVVFLLRLGIVPLEGLAVTPKAEAPRATFSVRVQLEVCPEYAFGGVTVHLGYKVGNDVGFTPATVTSESITGTTGVFELEIPSQHGTTPIQIAAFCDNSFGTGKASNTLTTSNCEALALLDSDQDGLTNLQEDSNCDNFYSPGDFSNPDNIDTDGDGFRDVFEYLDGTDPNNPGVSPRPKVFAGDAFDPDGDGNSNPVVWRGNTGVWYVRDFTASGIHLAIDWGKTGDTPFVYNSGATSTSDLGVVRNVNNQLLWLFRGGGFIKTDGSSNQSLSFGLFGDNIIPGPWESPGVTNPAVARLFANSWTFYIFLSDGTVKIQPWGGNGDVPFIQDFDGDGLLDIAIYRERESNTYVIYSSDNSVHTFKFGTPTSEFTFRGDVTGDGKADLTFWEPITGTFTSLISDNGFDDVKARNRNPLHFQSMQLGLYFIHLPLPWFKENGKTLYTVVDHNTGYRFIRKDNNPLAPPTAIQWGLPGDSQG